jgi:DNA modification methylase
MLCELKNKNCVEFLKNTNNTFDLSFLDPPFNQGKEYRVHNDKLDEKEYWDWMREVCSLIYEKTSKGGAIYFMQREKNAEFVLEVLRSSGWTLQNLIIWKKNHLQFLRNRVLVNTIKSLHTVPKGKENEFLIS